MDFLILYDKLERLLYWNKINFNKNYQLLPNKYLIFKPWNGGFNNFRMSFEIACVLAYRLNRILVLPNGKNFKIDNSTY